jgi:TonB family protein
MNSNLSKISIISSLALHLLLALLFFSLRYQLIEPEFKPLQVMQFGYQQINSSSKSSAALQSASAATDDFKFGKKSNTAPRKVDLPPAQFQSDDNIFVPQSHQTVRNNLDMNEMIGNSFEKRESNLSNFLPAESTAPREEAVLPATDDFLSSLQERMAEGSASDSPYVLAGEISARKVLQQTIPSYPEGLQRSVSVQVRLQVLPDGSVGQLQIIKKAGSPFDENALQALRNWKFNPISGETTQSGTVTFIYELK